MPGTNPFLYKVTLVRSYQAVKNSALVQVKSWPESNVLNLYKQQKHKFTIKTMLTIKPARKAIYKYRQQFPWRPICTTASNKYYATHF